VKLCNYQNETVDKPVQLWQCLIITTISYVPLFAILKTAINKWPKLGGRAQKTYQISNFKF